jgi:hypothetical protein
MRTRIDKCPKDALEIETKYNHSRKGKNIISERRWILSGVHILEHTPGGISTNVFWGENMKSEKRKKRKM